MATNSRSGQIYATVRANHPTSAELLADEHRCALLTTVQHLSCF